MFPVAESAGNLSVQEDQQPGSKCGNDQCVAGPASGHLAGEGETSAGVQPSERETKQDPGGLSLAVRADKPLSDFQRRVNTPAAHTASMVPVIEAGIIGAMTLSI